MAERKLVVKIVGDARSLERTFTRSSNGAKSFERDIGRASRGALSAAVSFRGLGRALAFGSFQFLGGAGIVFALKSTISAAEESQRVLAQTANAVERSGQSWAKYGQQIQEVALAQSNLSGFDDERLLGTFSNLVRRTGDVTQALKLNALATDVARGRNIDLEAAQALVLKASIGNVGALRRLGINVGKSATAYQALDLLQRKYAGSAAAYGRTASGAQDRFAVAIQNTQEVIGTALLPTITTYLNKGSDWLSQTENQKRVQQDVTAAVQGTATAVSALTSLIVKAAGALRDFDAATRSFNISPDLLKILQGKLGTGDTLIGTPGHRGIIGDLIGKLGVGSSGEQNGGDFSAADLKKSKDAAKAATDLTGALGKLSGVKTPTRKGISVSLRNTLFDNSIARILLRGGLGSIGDQIAALKRADVLIEARLSVTKDVTRRLRLEDELLQNVAQIKSLNTQQAADALQKRQDAVSEVIARLQLGVTKAQATASFTDDIAALQALQAGIRSEIREFGATADLEGQLFDAQQQIVQARRDQAAKRISDLTAKQFRQLGLSATGDAITPGVANLKKRLQQLSANIAGSTLDTPKLEAQLARFRKVLSEGLVPKDVRAKIKELLDGIADDLKNHSGKLTKFAKLDTSKFVQSITGLTAAQRKQLEAGLSQIGAGGTVPRQTATAGGFGGAALVVHTHVDLDGREVANNTTRHQQKRKRRNPPQKRGPHAGA